jgi:hypothetical protein
MKRLMQKSIGVLIACLIAFGVFAEDDLEARKQAAQQTVAMFMKELGGALKAEMAKGGPAQAITVCRDIAPSIAGRLSLENGWKVTRVGTRVRNPMIGMPDAWEQQVLQQFQERAGKGEPYSEMNYSEVVAEPDGRYFRFMKAIGVAPLCLTCHGPVEQIPESVRTALKNQYPHDRAVNYQVGDLRGAVSIKQPLDSAQTESKSN